MALSRGATAAPGRPERRGAWGALGAPVWLIRAPARADVPHRLDLVAAHRVDPVVEVDRRVAVWREELDALAQLGRARGIGDRQPPVLVAREGKLDTRPLHRLGREGLIGREGLEPALDQRPRAPAPAPARPA